MARKSRIHIESSQSPLLKPMYYVALYVRVSVFNGGKKDGDTIENQKTILQNYIAGKPYFVLTSIYIDNGESGVDFNRSEFNRLINDVKMGKVNCIVVKDLSRFGRNYIETGEYLEKIFPFLGVRFIAINDNYDSTEPNAADILRIHLKNLVNDVYAKDISRKICPVLETKQKRGDFIGSWAPYGYRKAEDNRHKLVIDEETAPVVRNIFKWRTDGWKYRQIVQELLRQEIPSPSQYRYANGIIKDQKLAQTIWKSTTVMRLLSNQEYLGHMVQGKKRAALWNNQTQTELWPEEWIIVKDIHEPIIDEDTFWTVQALNARASEKRKADQGRFSEVPDRENVLLGMAFCGECGAKLVRNKTVKERKQKEPKYIAWYHTVCPIHRAAPAKCSFTGIAENDLVTAVYEAVKMQLIIYQQKAELIKQEQTLKEHTTKENSWSLNREMAAALIESITIYNKTSITVHFRFEDEYQKLIKSMMLMGAGEYG
ncbi:MAG: recombinase family protein [Lachnospiraceae bacterium]